MDKDILFLLPPGFEGRGRREFCPECAEIIGVLAYYPAIRDSLDIAYQPISHPRPDLTRMLGEGNWNCPTLVLAQGSPDFSAPGFELAAPKQSNGHRYLDSARSIATYYSLRFGTAFPRGS